MEFLNYAKAFSAIFLVQGSQVVLVWLLASAGYYLSEFWFSDHDRQYWLINVLHLRKAGAIAVALVVFFASRLIWKGADYRVQITVALLIALAFFGVFAAGHAINFILGSLIIVNTAIGSKATLYCWQFFSGKAEGLTASKFYAWFWFITVIQVVFSMFLLSAEYDHRKVANVLREARASNKIANSVDELYDRDTAGLVMLTPGSVRFSRSHSKSFGSGDESYSLKVIAAYPQHQAQTELITRYVWIVCSSFCPTTKEFIAAEIWPLDPNKNANFHILIDYAMAYPEFKNYVRPPLKGHHIMLDPKPELIFSEKDWHERKKWRRQAVAVMGLIASVGLSVTLALAGKRLKKS